MEHKENMPRDLQKYQQTDKKIFLVVVVVLKSPGSFTTPSTSTQRYNVLLYHKQEKQQFCYKLFLEFL